MLVFVQREVRIKRRMKMKNREVAAFLGVVLLLSLCYNSDAFVSRQHRQQHHFRSSKIIVPSSSTSTLFACDDTNKKIPCDEDDDEFNIESISTRRNWISAAAAGAVAAVALTESANAFGLGKEYPIELVAVPDSDPDARTRKIQQITSATAVRRKNDRVTSVASSGIWGAAIWLLLGSRSNPIATPLANALYKKDAETWLQDRNEGLFAQLPWEFTIILLVVFAAIGFGTDQLLSNFVTDGSDISLQLAGVSVIAGGAIELGRISSGEKALSRDEMDRMVQLREEFHVFAQERLLIGRTTTNCHRTEVVRAYRRYYGKYRDPDSVEYPLTDLEIEQLLRVYVKQRYNIKMSSAGFYTGVTINTDADIVASAT